MEDSVAERVSPLIVRRGAGSQSALARNPAIEPAKLSELRNVESLALPLKQSTRNGELDIIGVIAKLLGACDHAYSGSALLCYCFGG